MMAYSTSQVARMAGIHKQTLLRWLYSGAVAEPKRRSNGGQIVRLWSERDVERVKKHKATHYRKWRGRKK